MSALRLKCVWSWHMDVTRRFSREGTIARQKKRYCFFVPQNKQTFWKFSAFKTEFIASRNRILSNFCLRTAKALYFGNLPHFRLNLSLLVMRASKAKNSLRWIASCVFVRYVFAVVFSVATLCRSIWPSLPADTHVLVVYPATRGILLVLAGITVIKNISLAWFCVPSRSLRMRNWG